MCGINGFTYQDGELLRKMHGLTRHRGPDDEGFFESPDMSLAHNRLSIIDLSPGGRQPMSTPDGRYTIVFNGEIYNYRELREELEGCGETFSSASDTEVLVRAFAVWGENSFSRFNGIFAFAIWDRDRQSLTLVRDRFGVKPLYYSINAGRLAFSSEMKALHLLQSRPALDRDAFSSYMRLLYVPAPNTLFQGIRKLPAGHVLRWRPGESVIERWWRLEEGSYFTRYEEAREQVRTRFFEGIRRQLVSDRPLGVFLSGGIDSTAILSAMRSEVSSKIHTFSVGYVSDVDEAKYNADAMIARQTAELFGTEHHELKITAQEAMDCFEESVWHMDEPIANHVQTSTYLLSKYAKPLITVALGGDGGDELFGGYPRYWYNSMIERISWIQPLLRTKSVRALAHRFGKAHALRMIATSSGIERQLAFVGQQEDVLSRLLRSGVYRANEAREAIAWAFDTPWKDRTNQLMVCDVQTWLAEESLMRTDKMTMAHGLEERVPFLDMDLVACAFRIPSRWKVDSVRQGKRILVDALRDMLPPHVLHQEKRAWMSPAAKWLRGPMRSYAEEILSPGYDERSDDLFNFLELRKVFDDHLEKRVYGLHTIWSLLTFRVWHRKYISNRS